MQALEQKYYTIEEYLELETISDHKHEYIDGQIIPMADGTTNHNQIALNFSTELNFAFKKLDYRVDYRVFMTDVRLWIPQKQIYTYPDIMIVTEATQYFDNRNDTIINPQIIIEVLSQSTKNYDREDKFVAYRTIPTFQEYLLISQNNIQVEHFFKTGKKRWSFCEYDPEDTEINLNSIDFKITLADIYNKVGFTVLES